MACRNDRLRRSLVRAVISVAVGAGSLASIASSGAASATSALLNRATSTTIAPAPASAATTTTSPTTTAPTSKPSSAPGQPERKPTPVSRLALTVTSDSSGRMLALNEMPDGWTGRPVNAAAAPFDCRHLQPAMGAPVRTERVGFIGPAGQSVTERIDVFRDELTALRSRDRLIERLNGCTTATFVVETETFRFERQAISVQSDGGPDSLTAWRESTFATSPVGESEYYFLLASGPTVVSVWTSTEKPVSDYRDLLETAAAAAFETPSCKVTWKAKSLRRCSDGRLDIDGRRVFGSGANASDEFELYPGRFVSTKPVPRPQLPRCGHRGRSDRLLLSRQRLVHRHLPTDVVSRRTHADAEVGHRTGGPQDHPSATRDHGERASDDNPGSSTDDDHESSPRGDVDIDFDDPADRDHQFHDDIHDAAVDHHDHHYHDDIHDTSVDHDNDRTANDLDLDEYHDLDHNVHHVHHHHHHDNNYKYNYLNDDPLKRPKIRATHADIDMSPNRGCEP